jgi:anti-anti-sigma factor
MQGPDFDFKCERRGRVALAAAGGRLDHTNAEDFRVALWPALDACTTGGEAVVLDLAKLGYISSAGLRILMLAARRVTEQGGTLVIAGLQPVVREIFQITRFDRVFRIFDDASAAESALAAG